MGQSRCGRGLRRACMEMGVAPSPALALELSGHAQIEPFFATARALRYCHLSDTVVVGWLQFCTIRRQYHRLHCASHWPTVVLSSFLSVTTIRLSKTCKMRHMLQVLRCRATFGAKALEFHSRCGDGYEMLSATHQFSFCLNLADVNIDHASALTQTPILENQRY